MPKFRQNEGGIGKSIHPKISIKPPDLSIPPSFWCSTDAIDLRPIRCHCVRVVFLWLQSWTLDSVVNESASCLRRKLVSSPALYRFLQAFTLLYSFLQAASHPYTASYTAGRSDNTQIHIPCHTQPASPSDVNLLSKRNVHASSFCVPSALFLGV